MEHGADGYKMNIDKKDKIYAIEQRIKSLNGVKSWILEGNSSITESIEDIDAKIEALTNALEMI
jgi:hypothetical protein